MLSEPGLKLRHLRVQGRHLRVQSRHLRFQRQDRAAYSRRENLTRSVQFGDDGHGLHPAALLGPGYPSERLPRMISDRRPHYVPTDPYYSLQFHLRNSNLRNGIPVDINIQQAWDITRGSGMLGPFRVTIIRPFAQ